MSSSNGDKQNHLQDGRYAAIYARVSTKDQGKGFSIPTPIEAGQKLAEREGYTIPETFIIIEELSIACLGAWGIRACSWMRWSATVSRFMSWHRRSRTPRRGCS